MRKFIIISGVWLAVLLAVSFFLFDNIVFKNDKWLADNHELNITKNIIEKEFEVADNFSIVFSGKDSVWTKQKVALFRQIESDLKSIGTTMRSPAKSKTAVLDGETIHFYAYEKAYDKGLFKTLDDWKDHIADSPYIGQVISKDNTVWQTVLDLDKDKDRIVAYQQIKSLFAKYKQDLNRLNLKASIIGSSGAYAITDMRAGSDLQYLGLASLLILLSAIIVFTRNIYISLWLFLTMGTGALLPMVMLYLFGYAVNSLHLILPILIMTITMADGLHIWFDYTVRKDAIGTVKKMAMPCFLTSFTTLGGTIIFYGDMLVPLHTVAVIGASSIIFSYGGIMLSSYVFMTLFGKKVLADKPVNNGGFKLLPIKVYKTFMLSLLIVGAIGLGFIESRSTFLDVFFKKSDVFYKSVQDVDGRLNGVQRINVLLEQSGIESFKSYKNFKKVLDLKADLMAIDGVRAVNGYNDAIGIIHKSFNGKDKYPDNTDVLAQEIFFAELSRSEEDKGILESWVSFNYSSSRMEIVLPLLTNKDLSKTMLQIKTALDSSGFDSVKWSGATVLFYEIGKYTVPSHIKGIIGTLIIAFISLLLAYGLSIAIKASLIGALPFIAMIGVLSLFGVNLDYSTVMLVALGMGLAIDDSIHTANYIKISKTVSIDDYLNRIGKVILITGFVLSMGYIVFFFSNIAMLYGFGIMMPITQVIASMFTVSAGILWIRNHKKTK